jgi:hypothetical protein
MTDPDDIEALSRTWREIADEAEFSVPATLRRRRRHNALLLLEAIGSGVALATAAFFWLAGDGIVFRVAGSVLVAAVLVGVVFTKRTRMGLGRWADWTPEGVLAFRLRECEVAMLNARYALVSSAVLLGFASFVWLAAELEWDVLPPGFHYLYAAVVAGTVTPIAIWATWRTHAKRGEHSRLRALLEELRDS